MKRVRQKHRAVRQFSEPGPYPYPALVLPPHGPPPFARLIRFSVVTFVGGSTSQQQKNTSKRKPNTIRCQNGFLCGCGTRDLGQKSFTFCGYGWLKLTTTGH
ncbi:cystathionine beta-lyase family protein involved in aluminum resistance [Anopheles sinensis]|uniref:Cystathionine beta-lyase family protein involved in aluminum resistance n=1 Tax=Anopheles sinensis TaxID=74873 RepID=A0A084WAN3_ANOSI|nr:cystathionine beta-lyase family protein involved in aluminum resistance [Anopheles sinensis]